MYIADLHTHSRYSRATSKECTPEYLDLWARRKGIHLIGGGDFTHPAWREELKEKLKPAEDGFYVLKKEYRIQDGNTPDHMIPRFVITGEISSIYKKYDKVRKVHSLLILPGLKAAENLSEKLEVIGNLHSDGRPILGLDCGIYWKSCWRQHQMACTFRHTSGHRIFPCSEHFPDLIRWMSASGI